VPEIVEIGSSISEAPRLEAEMVLGFGNGVKVDFIVRSRKDGRRLGPSRMDAAGNGEPNSAERHYLPSLH